jgi:hypothetical protein
VNVGLRIAPGLDKRPEGVLHVGHHFIDDLFGVSSAAVARDDEMHVRNSGKGCNGSAR